MHHAMTNILRTIAKITLGQSLQACTLFLHETGVNKRFNIAVIPSTYYITNLFYLTTKCRVKYHEKQNKIILNGYSMKSTFIFIYYLIERKNRLPQ